MTVRSIADAAGVNHGLIHHYFDSKAAVLGATMLRVEEMVLASLEDISDPIAAAGVFIQAVLARPSYPRLLSWMLLEGIDPTQQIGSFPVVDHLVDLVSDLTSASEARKRVFLLLVLTAGLASTTDFMADVTGLDMHEREQIPHWAQGAAEAIVTGNLNRHSPTR